MQTTAQDVTPAAHQKRKRGNGTRIRFRRKRKLRHLNRVPRAVTTALWDFLYRPDTVTSLRTATAMGRPAIEGISNSLVAEFGGEIDDRAVKQVIRHMVKIRMEALGYVVDKPRARTRSGSFSTGMTFRPAIPSESDSFNRWLDPQVRSPDGGIDPEKLAHVAHEWGVSFSAKDCSIAIRRLELGALLRAVVPKSDYESAERGADNE
jgi:hypothetical protein